jgi:hypothetical protein
MAEASAKFLERVGVAADLGQGRGAVGPGVQGHEPREIGPDRRRVGGRAVGRQDQRRSFGRGLSGGIVPQLDLPGGDHAVEGFRVARGGLQELLGFVAVAERGGGPGAPVAGGRLGPGVHALIVGEVGEPGPGSAIILQPVGGETGDPALPGRRRERQGAFQIAGIEGFAGAAATLRDRRSGGAVDELYDRRRGLGGRVGLAPGGQGEDPVGHRQVAEPGQPAGQLVKGRHMGGGMHQLAEGEVAQQGFVLDGACLHLGVDEIAPLSGVEGGDIGVGVIGGERLEVAGPGSASQGGGAREHTGPEAKALPQRHAVFRGPAFGGLIAVLCNEPRPAS